jgi:uncharacterized protein YfaS (alpha-2-macroglobulin family)
MRTVALALVSLGLASCGSLGARSSLETAADPAQRPNADSATPGSAKSNARIREYFPETLYWNPALITDTEGRAEIHLPMADSITTWRLSAFANTRTGALGSTTRGIRVFREFFVDVDFPVALTQNDVVQVPVAVYNYLRSPQRVVLEVEPEDWFELLDDAVKTVDLGSEEVRAAHFKIRAKRIGVQRLTIFAKAGDARDAVRRSVDVVPDGKKFEIVLNDRLSRRIERVFEIPADSVEGSLRVYCKCYPGVYAQMVEGVEGMLGMPHG